MIKNNVVLVLILICGFALRILAIISDPFLHPWDERFHALVGRNMIDSPLVPILRVNPISENYDPFLWCCNHIWLHKQPLFLWQMGLSMKIFGVSEWSMRLPSAIMGTLLIFLIYRIAILFSKRKAIALWAAVCLAFSNFHLQLISGIHGMDHNDVAHGFYVLASIWSLFEYKNSKKWYWILFVGIFSGFAVLNKWLTGLVVFFIWGLDLCLEFLKDRKIKKEVASFLLALLVCFVTFIPWQIYILYRFPDLASYVYKFNSRHITEALEGHEGTYLFYFKYLKDLLGNYIYLLLPIGIILSFRISQISQRINISIISALMFVFFFYSIIVKTKVDTYLFFMIPLAYIYIGICIDYFTHWLKKLISSYLVVSFMSIIIIFCCFKPIEVSKYFSNNNKERNDRIYNASIYRNLKNLIPGNIKVVMNMNSFEDIDVMFYNRGITAYHWTLSEPEFKEFEKKKIPIAVFEDHGNYKIPDYVKKYPYIYIIKEKLIDFQ